MSTEHIEKCIAIVRQARPQNPELAILAEMELEKLVANEKRWRKWRTEQDILRDDQLSHVRAERDRVLHMLKIITPIAKTHARDKDLQVVRVAELIAENPEQKV